MPETEPGKLRRNGQLSSCEPCRKSKQRCDHGRPRCARCEGRGRGEQCYYHPAPMAKRRKPNTQDDAGTNRSKATKIGDDAAYADVGDDAPFYALPSSSSAFTYASGLDARLLDQATSLVSMDNSLRSLSEPEPERDAVLLAREHASLTRNGIASSRLRLNVTPTLLVEGTQVLDLILTSPPALEEMTRQFYDELGDQPLGGPIAIAAWRATQNTFRGLRGDLLQSRKHHMSQMIFKSTLQPQKWPLSAADGALEQALSTGGVRWETVGIWFALEGMVIAYAEGTVRDLGAWGSDRKSAMHKAFEACMQCESFCNRAGQVNDLTLWQLILATTLATWCYGDDSYRAWSLMGQLSSAVYALGIHRGHQDGPPVPAYLKELRTRGVALSYELDMGLATFVGRPPRLGRHYCKLELPLDLSEAVIVGSPEAFSGAVARLDGNGWNKDGLVHVASRIRAIIMLNMIREEVLQLSLGLTPVDLGAQAKYKTLLLLRSSSTWDSLPSHMRYEPSLSGTMAAFTTMMLLSLRLEHLYSDFLLVKMIVNETSTDHARLIQTSHAILSLVLSAINQRKIMVRNRVDLEWWTVFYAMPCASVLILELFRQAEHPQHPTPISRSSIIRDLSVLISCCDHLTEPGQSNYEICKQAQSIFSRSLDHVLNHSAGTSTTPRQDSAAARQTNADFSDSMALENVTMLTDDPELLAWLDTYDLQVDPWLDFLHDPTQDPAGGSQHFTAEPALSST